MSLIHFEGYCEHCKVPHTLPCTPEAVAEARRYAPVIREHLESGKGRMVGVLLAEDHLGRRVYLRAYSGSSVLEGLAQGWAPPTRKVNATQVEEEVTFARLNRLSGMIKALEWPKILSHLKQAQEDFERAKKTLQLARRRARQERESRRRDTPDDAQLLERLRQESWDESVLYRAQLKAAKAPLEDAKAQHDAVLLEMTQLKNDRRQLSNRLQMSFNDEHELLNFAGESVSVEEAHISGAVFHPGSGECAAPKLLQDAVRRGLRPLAIAEVWVGESQDEPKRVEGRAYGPCEERCLPIMGYLLCGSEKAPHLPDGFGLPIIAEGSRWLAVNKPPNFLSAPGRGADKIDSTLTRVRRFYGAGADAQAAHRLDYETTGIHLIALDGSAQALLQAQFASRSIQKHYLSWLDGTVEETDGIIELPLGPAKSSGRTQAVRGDGKVAITRYRVLGHAQGKTLVVFEPLTGRSHQLRVHAADARGLKAPIVGDALYGENGPYLFLHAWRLSFRDPTDASMHHLECPPPEHWPPETSSYLQAFQFQS